MGIQEFEEVGERIKELRIKNGLSQEELAEKLAILPVTVENWELGNNTPTVQTLQELASLFDCTTDYLLCGQRKDVGEDRDGKELKSTKRRIHSTEKSINKNENARAARKRFVNKVLTRLLPVIPLCLFLLVNVIYHAVLSAIFKSVWSDGSFPQGDGAFWASVFDWLNMAYFWCGAFCCCVSGIVFKAENIMQKRKEENTDEKED